MNVIIKLIINFGLSNIQRYFALFIASKKG